MDHQRGLRSVYTALVLVVLNYTTNLHAYWRLHRIIGNISR